MAISIQLQLLCIFWLQSLGLDPRVNKSPASTERKAETEMPLRAQYREGRIEGETSLSLMAYELLPDEPREEKEPFRFEQKFRRLMFVFFFPFYIS